MDDWNCIAKIDIQLPPAYAAQWLGSASAAILVSIVFAQFQPMPLLKRPLPFDDDDWLFELKYDGFRALAIIEHGRAQLLSRNGHPFASFAELGKHIAASLPNIKLT